MVQVEHVDTGIHVHTNETWGLSYSVNRVEHVDTGIRQVWPAECIKCKIR